MILENPIGRDRSMEVDHTRRHRHGTDRSRRIVQILGVKHGVEFVGAMRCRMPHPFKVSGFRRRAQRTEYIISQVPGIA